MKNLLLIFLSFAICTPSFAQEWTSQVTGHYVLETATTLNCPQDLDVRNLPGYDSVLVVGNSFYFTGNGTYIDPREASEDSQTLRASFGNCIESADFSVAYELHTTRTCTNAHNVVEKTNCTFTADTPRNTTVSHVDGQCSKEDEYEDHKAGCCAGLVPVRENDTARCEKP